MSSSYTIKNTSADTNNTLIRYSYKLLDPLTGQKVTGVNLFSKDANNNTTFDAVESQKSYDLLVEAKTKTNSAIDWNLETFDINLNLANGIFDNWSTANIEFGSQINFAKSSQILDSSYFDNIYSESKEGIRVTGAIGNHIASSNSINNSQYTELFKIKNLRFNSDSNRGVSENGETLALDIITDIYDTTVSNYQDTNGNGILDNVSIKSLSELGYGEVQGSDPIQIKQSSEIDRSNEIYTYETFAELIEHGTTLWSQRSIGSNTKSFLIRNGATINGRSWWSNVGNFETDLEQMVFTKKTGFANLEFDSKTDLKNLSSEGKTFVDGYGVTGVSSSGSASSWDDTTSESFSVDFKVKVSGTEGSSITGESFYSFTGTDLKDDTAVSNNKDLLSNNVVTYQGDLNYDGRVSLIDLAYLNAGKLNADKNNSIVPEDVDADFNGVIDINDLAIIEKDFLESIHDVTNHQQSWDDKSWEVPTLLNSERSGLNVGTIDKIATMISYDNSNFIYQENLETLGYDPSVNIPAVGGEFN